MRPTPANAQTIPLQITFRHIEPSPALDARIRELVSRFQKFSRHVLRCHIILEPLPGHPQQGARFDFRIEITLPDEQITICRARSADPAHENAHVALRDAFRAARRKLQDYERRRRGAVKTHAEKAGSWAADDGSGQIETPGQS